MDNATKTINIVEEEYLNINLILKILNKRKKIIGLISFLSLFLSVIYALSVQKLYKGSFQIVLRDQSNNNPLVPRQFASLIREANNVDLNTQVGILKSPSVLMPVFQYVKDVKNKNGDFKNTTYKKWFRKSLDIKLERGTKILEINYVDTDKNIILNALNKISDTYQDYSQKERFRGLENGLEYLSSQIKIYKKNSSNSAKNFQEYALKNDMAISITNSQIDGNDELFSNELALKNRLNLINKYIDEINVEPNNIPKNFELSILLYQNLGIKTPGDPVSLDIIDAENNKLYRYKTVFTEQDPILIKQKSKILYLKEAFNNHFFQMLSGIKTKLEIDIKNSSKPKDVYLNYKNLANKSIRDDSILQDLEKQKQMLSLEKAKVENPWELITSPTLIKNSISLARRSIVFNGLIIGLFSSLFIIYLYERYLDLVYTPNDFANAINPGFILDLSNRSAESYDESLKVLFNNLKGMGITDNIGIFKVGKIPDNLISNFQKNFQLINKNIQVSFYSDLSKSSDFKLNLIVFSPGLINFRELRNLKQNISLTKENFIGILVFE